MKYLPLRDFEDVTSALNFNTPDCHVIGGCDLYTTKAAGTDKKLYKNIEHSLEAQHESLLRISASLSPPQSEILAESLNLSRSSPFGPLSQISSRRTFAYLIATLNASHPDYDFSHILKPTDFRRERSLRQVMNTIDTTLYNLRPRPTGALLAAPNALAPGGIPLGAQTPGGSQIWGPRMWGLIDNEMNIRDCHIYCYVPEEDPFDGEDSAIWSLNYFFFNKSRKRVCYMYIRGQSVISHSPPVHPSPIKRRASARNSISFSAFSANKRAKYWLGDRPGYYVQAGYAEDDDEVLHLPGDDEIDADVELDWDREVSWDGDVVSDEEREMRTREDKRQRDKSAVRGMSEGLVESMEV
ncbi:repressor of RNA polymerase III transcription MAF1 [Patellaria atrata CBS 101060]|uniref:Repressor of RNA polymerase III transcription MAF1 n=1 Tax=Patellaria atrata CBS 101060 TaxID=1346257 RepID=A0A9P4S919_9PEZI|nr:repressor of RNA polymerase III transcription MAF1 [Patellaria atrata CBS 101060]